MLIIHIDMDAFYASVEELDNPQIRGNPVIVGGPARERGVVSAASYPARRFGVHSAMPMATANRLCPQAIVIPPRHQRYVDISRQIRAIFDHYTPLVEPLSLDEAFLDVSASARLFGPVEKIAARIKCEIQEEIGLTASVGIAPNKFLAKLASDADKPDGFVHIREKDIQNFLDPMPVTRLWGVGKSAAARMQKHGIFQVRELREATVEKLENLFGPAQARHLWKLSRGIDERIVSTGSAARSISRETTFATDVDDPENLQRTLLALTEHVCRRLRKKHLVAKTVQIKYRRSDFTTFTRSSSLASPTSQTAVIWQAASHLFNNNIDRNVLPLRLIGLALSSLIREQHCQPDIFDPAQDPVDTLSDSINSHFGQSTIYRAAGLAKQSREQD